MTLDFTRITACGECCADCEKKLSGACPGCIEADGYVPERSGSGRCKIHACARAHNVRFCGICPEFPCGDLPKLISWNPDIVEHLTKLAGLFREKEKMIRLENVDPDNWRPGLRVSQAQRKYVADSAGILARAWAYREERSRAYIIYEDVTPVGMALYYDFGEFDAYDFSQFFLDERYQGRGLGKKAAKLIIDEMRSDGKYDKVVLCYIDGNEPARRMYESLGFRLTGEVEGDEVIMGLRLR